MNVTIHVVVFAGRMVVFFSEDLDVETYLRRELLLRHIGNFDAEDFFCFFSHHHTFARLEGRARGRFRIVTMGFFFAVIVAVAFLMFMAAANQ
ncbi:MAG: hypothetical protein WDM76_10945 [Limisphaerales bacterium]